MQFLRIKPKTEKHRLRFTALCLIFVLCASMNVFAQQQPVKGTIVDGNGDPVIGASVVEKGTSNGVISDLDGNFSLSVNPGSILQVSYVGYISQEIKAETGRTLRIELKEDSEMLDEVVVVGFGSQKKVNLTGSVGIATAKELESRPVNNAVQALQGLVPGLNISTNSGELDNTMDLSIRGKGTIGDGSSGSPLILIDGMEGDLNRLNPQDIESISVLKDAAASSIYGSRAPFGVILVTTKSGTAGKVSINYNNSFRVSNPIGVPEAMDSYSFAVMMNNSLINNGQAAYFKDDVMQKMLDFQAGKISGGLDPSPTNPTAWEDRWSRGYGNTDIYKETYKSNVFSQEHNLSTSGGSDKYTYYASLNYLDQGGTLKLGDDGLKRYNVAAKINATLTNWLKFNYSTRFTREDFWRPTVLTSSFYGGYGRGNWPNLPMYDPNGYMMQDAPLDLAYGGSRKTQVDRQYHQGAFTIEPIKNWITKVGFNYSVRTSDAKQATIPAYRHDVEGNLMDTKKTSSLKQEQSKENYLNLNIYSEYSTTFKDAHNVKIMGGFQAEEHKRTSLSVSKNGLILYEMPEFDLTNGLLGNGNTSDATINGNTREWATAGFFGRLNYDYKGRYLAEVNFRYDGTSRFRRGNRWQTSPSFSAGWNISQENFWEPLLNHVNLLKLRLSYGELGNQNTTDLYPTYRSMNLGILNGNWLTNGTKPNTANVGGLVSSMLTWESVRTWNVGIDFGLLNNRLTGSFDYFIRYTDNMVGPAPELPNTLGVAVPKTNNCDLKTNGWELAISWRDRLNNGLGYGITASLSDQNTYIESYPGNPTNSIDSYIAGQKMGLIWGFETIGIAKTQDEMDKHLASLPNGGQSALGKSADWKAGDIMYRDLNNDGQITEGSRTLNDHGDLKILGDANPHYFLGIDLTADWKGFDLRAFFQGVLKHDFWPGGDSSNTSDGPGGYFWGVRGNMGMWHTRGFKQHEDYFRGEPTGLAGYELPANTDAYFPRVIVTNGGKNQRVQSRYMQNARYIRLKNLQLGYTLPNSWVQKAGFSKCRIFVSGENLLTITPLFDIFDPETAMGGIGGNAYPLSRTWSCGLSLTF